MSSFADFCQMDMKTDVATVTHVMKEVVEQGRGSETATRKLIAELSKTSDLDYQRQ
mgnify:CR=1 FL=1